MADLNKITMHPTGYDGSRKRYVIERMDFFVGIIHTRARDRNIPIQDINPHINTAISETFNWVYKPKKHDGAAYTEAVTQINGLCEMHIPDKVERLLKE